MPQMKLTIQLSWDGSKSGSLHVEADPTQTLACLAAAATYTGSDALPARRSYREAVGMRDVVPHVGHYGAGPAQVQREP